jgi:hypothetical protein
MLLLLQGVVLAQHKRIEEQRARVGALEAVLQVQAGEDTPLQQQVQLQTNYSVIFNCYTALSLECAVSRCTLIHYNARCSAKLHADMSVPTFIDVVATA